jgi:Protein of unknown function (DUF3168)
LNQARPAPARFLFLEEPTTMTQDASLPLHRGLVAHLKQDLSLRRHLGDPPCILERAPGAGETVPCLAFGDFESRAWRSAAFDGQEHDIRLELWTGEGGAEASKAAAGEIIDRLHNADFRLAGHTLVDLQFESAETRFHPDRQAWHCRLRFKALTVAD